MAVNLNEIKSEYPFTPKVLKIGSLDYSYLDEGFGETIVMVHGNPTWSFYYRKLVKALRGDYRVVVPDHIGCGLSSKPGAYNYRLEQHTANLTNLIDTLGLKDITLMMHDWGGAIGMGYAVAHPENIKRLVIFNTSAFVSKNIPPSINFCKTPLIGSFVVRGLNGFVSPAVNLSFATAKKELFTREVKKGYLSPYSSWAERVAIDSFVKDIPMKESHPSWEMLKSIENKLHLLKEKPKKIIWGMQDFCFNETFLNKWLEIYPDADTLRLDDCGHFVVEDGYEQIVPTLNAFMGKEKTRESWNIALQFTKQSKKKPSRVAVARHENGEYKYISFGQLEINSNKLAGSFKNIGISKASRVILMVTPGIPFVTTAYALLKAGAVPVFIDPGMGVDNLVKCVKEVAPTAFIGTAKAHLLRLAYRGHFKSIKILVTIGTKLLWGGSTYENLLARGDEKFKPEIMQADDSASIIFTTGSTGTPKGVSYTHRMFNAQLETIRDTYNITPDDVDLSAFPLFALFATALGMKTVIPDMDPTKPAKVFPQNIVNAVNEQGVTFTFGSPAIWNSVSNYCIENETKLPSLTRVLMAGAPVAKEIHDRLLNYILPKNAETHTPYGATEALPISNMTGSEVLKETGIMTSQGKGICVGKPLALSKIRVIEISDSVIDEWDDSKVLPAGEIGEIVVKGKVVSPDYFGLYQENKNSKIKDGNSLWHRMGDIGYFDKDNRLWFCGRKVHRVVSSDKILYTVCTEAIFNNHPDVFRSALVGLGKRGKEQPVIIIEKEKNSSANLSKLKDELLELATSNELTDSIKDILFYKEFPTDIRHNAKIFREKLKVWAESKLRDKVPI